MSALEDQPFPGPYEMWLRLEPTAFESSIEEFRPQFDRWMEDIWREIQEEWEKRNGKNDARR